MSHNCTYLSYISKVADVIPLNSSEIIWHFFYLGSNIKLMLNHQTQGIWNFSDINLYSPLHSYYVSIIRYEYWIPKLIAYNQPKLIAYNSSSILFSNIDVGDTYSKELLTGSGPSIHNCWLLHTQKRTRKEREESASNLLNNPQDL